MPHHHRLPPMRAILLASCAAFAGLAGTTVTISNESGHDLLITRAGGKTDAPILVTAKSDDLPAVPRPLSPPPKPSMLDEAAPAGSFDSGPGAGPDRPSPHHYLLKHGDAATFWYEEKGKDLESELILHRVDSEAGVTFDGIVIFSLRHRPGPGPDGLPEPEASLTLPGGPTPALRRIPCNRNLSLLSSTELIVLSGSAQKVTQPLEQKDSGRAELPTASS